MIVFIVPNDAHSTPLQASVFSQMDKGAPSPQCRSTVPFTRYTSSMAGEPNSCKLPASLQSGAFQDDVQFNSSQAWHLACRPADYAKRCGANNRQLCSTRASYHHVRGVPARREPPSDASLWRNRFAFRPTALPPYRPTALRSTRISRGFSALLAEERRCSSD